MLSDLSGASVLEIGCGWGGFAELAARERDLQVRGISLSREQLRYAESRIEAAALSKQVGFEFRDYRDYGPSDAQYDGVVSIEMYEAVGERYWPAYFQAISDRLRPGAHAVVQGITIAERLFERYREGSDFIQQYVFPGGMLATPSRIEAEAARAGLMLVDRFAFGRDYAETLRRWHAAFVENLDPVRALGFDERFIRTWKFYLAYCEAAFDAGCCDVFQFTFMKGAAPGRRVEPCSKAN